VRNPAASQIEAAEEATPESTLIAVGSRTPGVVQRLRLGSVSTKVLRAARRPVLVAPQIAPQHQYRRATRGGVGPAAGSEIRRGPGA
jgi:hypothetical protein